MRLEGHNSSSVVLFLPKMQNLFLIMRKHYRNPHWGTLRNNWPVLFQKRQGHHRQERSPKTSKDWKTHRLQTGELTAKCSVGSWLTLEQKKDIGGETGEIWTVSSLVNWLVPLLITFFFFYNCTLILWNADFRRKWIKDIKELCTIFVTFYFFRYFCNF